MNLTAFTILFLFAILTLVIVAVKKTYDRLEMFLHNYVVHRDRLTLENEQLKSILNSVQRTNNSNSGTIKNLETRISKLEGLKKAA